MLSLIEVTCPHCGTRGQIMLPPLGAIIIGPCPQCKELVAVFCGSVLPLEKAILTEGSSEDKHDHLMSVLTEFLEERVSNLLTEVEKSGKAIGVQHFSHEFGEEGKPEEATEEPKTLPQTGERPITKFELDQFKQVDLKLLDNSAYFKSVFD